MIDLIWIIEAVIKCIWHLGHLPFDLLFTLIVWFYRQINSPFNLPDVLSFEEEEND